MLDRIARYLDRLNKNRNIFSLASGSMIHESAKLTGTSCNGKIEIGEGVKALFSVITGDVSVGRFTTINGPNVEIMSRIHPVRIGSFCSIARNTSILENNHKISRATTYFIARNLFGEPVVNDVESKGEIVIGSDVWIGAHCCVLSGAAIGHGAVVAANSVVIGEVPPYAIVGGSPAKVIKYRFGKEVIRYMLQLKWWEWDMDKIKQNRTFLTSSPEVEKIRALLEHDL